MPCTKCGSEEHNSKTCPYIVETFQIDIPEDILTKFKTIVDILEEVAKTLKKGRTECVYQNAIIHELQARSILCTKEETIPIMYKGKYVGQERLDIILTSWLDIILELKAIAGDIKPEHYWQVLSYMRYKKYNYGIVANFSQSLNKQLGYSFVIIHEDKSYIYDVSTGQGSLLDDY
jgi:GxxExxY protein